MDSISNENDTEEQSNIFVLPDAFLVRILSELSWKDILNVRFVSRSFYNFIHENYHLLDRRKVYGASIVQNEKDEKHPFRLRMVLKNVNDENSYVNVRDHEKVLDIQSVEKLTGILKMVDMRNPSIVSASSFDSLDIFGILKGFFQKGTKVKLLEIHKVMEKDFESFRTFIEKFSSVQYFNIHHLCGPSTGPMDVYSLFSLSSFNDIRYFQIVECDKTKILSADIVAKLLRNNPNIENLSIGSTNIEFLRTAFKEFFTMDQPHQMENECHFYEMDLTLSIGSEFEHHLDILRNELSELENVEEVEISEDAYDSEDVEESEFSDDAYDSEFPEFVLFKSIENCKNCPNNGHKINRCVTIVDAECEGEEWNH